MAGALGGSMPLDDYQTPNGRVPLAPIPNWARGAMGTPSGPSLVSRAGAAG